MLQQSNLSAKVSKLSIVHYESSKVIPWVWLDFFQESTLSNFSYVGAGFLEISFT